MASTFEGLKSPWRADGLQGSPSNNGSAQSTTPPSRARCSGSIASNVLPQVAPGSIGDLTKALDALSTERLQRLVDRIEHDPDIEVTVGASRPQCPMVLAGLDPQTATPHGPEHRFAAVWDRCATAEPGWWMPVPSAGRPARRSDVQLLLRTANAVLATRLVREAAAATLYPARTEFLGRSEAKW